MKILVTGGAGYIGSHICRALQARGHSVYVLDDMRSGHKEVVVGELIQISTGNPFALEALFKQYTFDAVIHCAALINVADSMRDPTGYYHANVTNTLNLLQHMVRAKVKTIIFSSSCSVYGTPEEYPVLEDTPLHPESVYAETKMIVERMILWYKEIYGMNYGILRYFNACGAAADGSTGEWHEPETHLIPNVIRAGLAGKPVTIFGNDYDTPDGTCIRDYVHVEDLSEAHVEALEYIEKENMCITANLGSGQGHSNLDIVHAVEKELGVTIPVQYAKRRHGDPARIAASHGYVQAVLGWFPRHTLQSIIRSAVAWEKKQSAQK